MTLLRPVITITLIFIIYFDGLNLVYTYNVLFSIGINNIEIFIINCLLLTNLNMDMNIK